MNFSDKRKVIHINYFGAQVDQVYFPHLEVVGDIGNTIWRLKEGLKGVTTLKWDLRYFKYVRDNFEEHLKVGVNLGTCPLGPPFLLGTLRRAVPDDGIVCLDNGLYKVPADRDSIHTSMPVLFPAGMVCSKLQDLPTEHSASGQCSGDNGCWIAECHGVQDDLSRKNSRRCVWRRRLHDEFAGTGNSSHAEFAHHSADSERQCIWND